MLSADESQNILAAAEAARAEVADEVAVYIDLAGGVAEGLSAAGWSPATDEGSWYQAVAPDASITLPEPERQGFTFQGWDSNEDGQVDVPAGSVTPNAEITYTALWERNQLQVTFTSGSVLAGDPAAPVTLTTTVPYEAVLWTGDIAPLKGATFSGDPETATVNGIEYNGAEYDNVLVARRSLEDAVSGDTLSSYVYTFELKPSDAEEGISFFAVDGAGIMPSQAGSTFVFWKMTQGGEGYQVLENDTVFTAQYEKAPSYVINIHYRQQESGITVAPSTTHVVAADEVSGGTIEVKFEVPVYEHYTVPEDNLKAYNINGKLVETGADFKVDDDNVTVTATINVGLVFPDPDVAQTNYLSIVAGYDAETVKYKVEYYQQDVNQQDYTLKETVEETVEQPYGSLVVPERKSDDDESYDGFQVAARSRLALADGVRLEEPATQDGDLVWDEDSKTFTIKIYYDRAAYFIYPFANTTESTVSPLRVVLGASTAKLTGVEPTREGYKFVNWKIYRLDDQGNLVEEEDFNYQTGTMPAYDLYAIAQWKPVNVDFKLVLWLERPDSPEYANVFEKTVDLAGVQAESKLAVGIKDDTLTVSSGDSAAVGNSYTSESLLKEYVLSAYQDRTSFNAEQYTQFFSFDANRTKTSPGNIALAEQAGADVPETGLDDSFTVQANADGTTSINVCFKRNFYAVDLVLARVQGNQAQVSDRTNGGLVSSDDANYIDYADASEFAGFNNASLVREAEKPGGAWKGEVQTYQLAPVDGETIERAPIGRYGHKIIDGQEYIVYQITAKFEAPVDEFWPTGLRVDPNPDNERSYISLGPDKLSYYRQVTSAGTDQHNILNIYSTFDEDILLARHEGADSAYTALATDASSVAVTHTMLSYWNTGAPEYTYYFLRELLDAETPDTTEAFDISKAEAGQYDSGDIVIYNDRYYVFDTSDEGKQVQRSTSDRAGQNQPSLTGFVNAGKQFTGKGTDKGPANIYFFYNRERYSVQLHNGDGIYTPPQDTLNREFGGVSLRELGWESIVSEGDNKGTITVRYGGSLAPLGDAVFMIWLTDPEKGALTSPDVTAGENQRYFTNWYLNQMQSVTADFYTPASPMRSLSGNVNLYAGWSTPRYTTSYALNGGTWQDKGDSTIAYTLVVARLPRSASDTETETVFFAYPHGTPEDGGADAYLYWYYQTELNDRLHIQQMYEVTGGLKAFMHWDEDAGHWLLNDGVTFDKLLKGSEPSTRGSLTGSYFCYLGYGDADEFSHAHYVSINRYLGDALDQPLDPVRNGYRFAGWYEFDESAASDESQRVLLADELVGTGVSVDAYDEGHVYLNSVGDAFLLHRDEQGRLYYYADQVGLRMSFEQGAAVVTATRTAYAAWVPQGETTLTTMHVVPADAAAGLTFPDVNGKQVVVESCPKITLTINGSEQVYYIVESTQQQVDNGDGVPVTATRMVDGNAKVWLPGRASMSVSITGATQTGTLDSATPESATNVTLASDTGCYRLASGQAGAYEYFAYFIYEQTNEVSYNVYAINLALAVAEGALPTYEDTFTRDNPPADDAAYVFDVTEHQHTLSTSVDEEIITVAAPELAGWTVYRDTQQTLPLAADASTNNVYFYYVAGDGTARYSITYHLMHNGSYETGYTATFTNVPAGTGEVLTQGQLEHFYSSLVSSAYAADAYSDADSTSNEGKLFARYKDMKVEIRRGKDEAAETFTVGGSTGDGSTGGADSLTREEALAFVDGAIYDGHNPTNESLVLTDDSHVDVYLKYAQLTVQKADWGGAPVEGVTFGLQRLVPVDPNTAQPAGDVVLYDLDGDGTSEQYVVDETFNQRSATADGSATTQVSVTSDSQGNAVFYNLAADERYVYALTETAWPQGYTPLHDPVYVVVYQTDAEGKPVYQVTYTVRNNGVVKLPVTGSLGGVYLPLLAGGALVTLVVATGALRRPRDRRYR